MPMPGEWIRPPKGAGQAQMEERREGKEDIEYREKGEGRRRGQVGLGWGDGGRGGAGREREGSRGSVGQIGIHAAI